MNVYVLSDDVDYEGGMTLGVFSSMEKAQAAAVERGTRPHNDVAPPKWVGSDQSTSWRYTNYSSYNIYRFAVDELTED